MSDDPFDFERTAPLRRQTISTGYKPGMSGENQLAALAVHGDPEVTGKFAGGKNKKKAQPTHYPRVTKWCDEQNWFSFKTERLVYDPRTGAVRKQDLLGFMDMMAMTESGSVIAIQVTTKEQVAAHIRKFVSAAESGGVVIHDAIRKWLARHGSVVILGFYKDEKGRWAFTKTWVTDEVLDEAIQRKRK